MSESEPKNFDSKKKSEKKPLISEKDESDESDDEKNDQAMKEKEYEAERKPKHDDNNPYIEN